jgi:hypothetical protein
MRRLLAALTLLGSLSAAAPAALAQQPPACQFVLGFKDLHDMDPGDIGDCIDNQASQPNGDAQQHTSKGLMAWRKADNWTAFTNGYMTWINGPQGLQSRLNTDRFDWEAAPAPAPAPAAPAPAPAASPAPAGDQGPATIPATVAPYSAPDGATCPAPYSIKGIFPSHQYLLAGQPGYDAVTAKALAVCFIDEATAKGAGYHP